jgi:predicted HTH domain antitoxin
MLITLLIAGLISGVLGDIIEAVIIFIMVFLSVAINFYQESSAERAANALRKRVTTPATVLRNRSKKEVYSVEDERYDLCWFYRFHRPSKGVCEALHKASLGYEHKAKGINWGQ